MIFMIFHREEVMEDRAKGPGASYCLALSTARFLPPAFCHSAISTFYLNEFSRFVRSMRQRELIRQVSYAAHAELTGELCSASRLGRWAMQRKLTRQVSYAAQADSAGVLCSSSRVSRWAMRREPSGAPPNRVVFYRTPGRKRNRRLFGYRERRKFIQNHALQRGTHREKSRRANLNGSSEGMIGR